jgi:hypothetical protein
MLAHGMDSEELLAVNEMGIMEPVVWAGQYVYFAACEGGCMSRGPSMYFIAFRHSNPLGLSMQIARKLRCRWLVAIGIFIQSKID